MHISLWFLKNVFLRVILPAMLVAVLYSVVVFFVLLPRYENVMLGQKKKIIKYQVEFVQEVLSCLVQDVDRGKLTLSAAQKRAAEVVTKLRYGPGRKNYFWLTTLAPVVIAHPYQPDQVGRNMGHLRDKRGKYFLKSFVSVVKSRGEGYVTYYWQWHDDSSKIVPKLAYVKKFKPWNWIVGTGVYIEDVSHELAQAISNVIKYSLFAGLLLLVLVGYLVFHTYSVEKNRRKNEIELRQLNLELEKRVEARTSELSQSLTDLQRMQAQLVEAEKMAALGGLVAGVAHEINTPVGVCVTAITHLQSLRAEVEKILSEKGVSVGQFQDFMQRSDEVVKLIHVNLVKAAGLVSSFKRVAVDQTVEKLRRFDVGEYVNEVMISLQNILKKNEVYVEQECASSIFMESYPGVLSQILTHFVLNAVQHAFSGEKERKIKITLSQVNDRVVLSFVDNGIGISADIKAKIFDPFYTTKRGDGALGLGLHIVYNMVAQQLKGRMTCESVLGEGTSFVLDLPLRIEG